MSEVSKKTSPFLSSYDPANYKLTVERVSLLNQDGSETEVCPTCNGDNPVCNDVCWRKKNK